MNKEKRNDYKIQGLLKWYEKFNNKDIRIKTQTQQIDVRIQNLGMPHMAGLHYINSQEYNKKHKIRGHDLLEFIKKKRLTDTIIKNRVKKYNFKKRKEFLKRVLTVKRFLENLEESTLVRNTNSNTTIKSDIFLINKIGNHTGYLAINQNKDVDYFETYFINKSNNYFRSTDLYEKVESIEIYDKRSGEWQPFSFGEARNRRLKAEYRIKKNLTKQNKKIEINNEKSINTEVYDKLTNGLYNRLQEQLKNINNEIIEKGTNENKLINKRLLIIEKIIEIENKLYTSRAFKEKREEIYKERKEEEKKDFTTFTKRLLKAREEYKGETIIIEREGEIKEVKKEKLTLKEIAKYICNNEILYDKMINQNLQKYNNKKLSR